MVQIVSNFTSYNHDIHERASSELFLHLIILFIVHYLFVFFNVSIHYLSVCLSICPFIHSSIHLYICPSIHLSFVHRSIGSVIYHLSSMSAFPPSTHSFAHLSIHLLVSRLFTIHPSICFFTCPVICLSIFHPFTHPFNFSDLRALKFEQVSNSNINNVQ